jgi:hypothetical protein
MAKTGGSMSALRRIGTFGAAVTVVVSPAATSGVGRAAADTTVALRQALRRCDFSSLGTVPMVPRPDDGDGVAVIHISGSNASAQVRLVDPDEPGAHFDVGLIQEPRPRMVTIQESIRQGATGVWVIVERPNPNSQNPAEFYTSEFVAPV